MRVVLPVDVDGVGTMGDGFNSLAEVLLPFRVVVAGGVSSLSLCLATVRLVGVLFFDLSVTGVAVLLAAALLPADFRLDCFVGDAELLVLRALFGLRFGIVRAFLTGVASSLASSSVKSSLERGEDLELFLLRDFLSSCDSSVYSDRSNPSG